MCVAIPTRLDFLRNFALPFSLASVQRVKHSVFRGVRESLIRPEIKSWSGVENESFRYAVSTLRFLLREETIGTVIFPSFAPRCGSLGYPERWRTALGDSSYARHATYVLAKISQRCRSTSAAFSSRALCMRYQRKYVAVGQLRWLARAFFRKRCN